MPRSVDSGMVFESFVVGPGNRVAWEAARTTSESPGAAYNPLFIYSDTGLGKTHLMAAIANRAREVHPEARVVYTPLERMLRDLEKGESVEAAYLEADILLVDDLQFLGPHVEDHQALFHILDHLLLAGRQVVLACDQPPLEMGELDDRLLSRFSGGLVVDIDRPNLETRRGILQQRLEEIDATLEPEVVDAIARVAIENVRQLKGALHRILALQDAEDRVIGPEEVDRVLGDVVGDQDMPWFDESEAAQSEDEFQEFLSDVSGAVEQVVRSPEWREELARAILKWESEGFKTSRLEAYLDSEEPIDAERVISEFERDAGALREVADELQRLDPDRMARVPLRDPDRVAEARSALDEVRREQSTVDEFFLDREKVVWNWPVLEELLIEDWGDGDQG